MNNESQTPQCTIFHRLNCTAGRFNASHTVVFPGFYAILKSSLLNNKTKQAFESIELTKSVSLCSAHGYGLLMRRHTDKHFIFSTVILPHFNILLIFYLSLSEVSIIFPLLCSEQQSLKMAATLVHLKKKKKAIAAPPQAKRLNILINEHQ